MQPNEDLKFMYGRCKRIRRSIISSIPYVPEYVEAIAYMKRRGVFFNEETLFMIIAIVFEKMTNKGVHYRTALEIAKKISKDLHGDINAWKTKVKGDERLLFDEKYGAFYEDMIASRKNEDYVVNEEQLAKFNAARELFREMCEKHGGTFKADLPEPKVQHGDITAEVSNISFSGREIAAIKTIAGDSSAVAVIPLTDGTVSIEIVIPNIFVEK